MDRPGLTDAQIAITNAAHAEPRWGELAQTFQLR
jgi:hypothetical protein